MLWLYRILFVPALLVVAPRYLLRMRRRGGYRADFGHRFGGSPPLPAKSPTRPRIWLQAVSVGEMLAIEPILEALQRDGAEVYLTTTTSTGRNLADARYASLTAGIGYFPIDWWLFSRRAWRRIDPDLVLLTEGELWPEHLRQAVSRRVPVLCLNARLSDRSFARLRRLRSLARLLLDGVTRFLPASAQDGLRLQELGVAPERLRTTGNIKLDVRIPALTAGERAQLRRELGLPEGPVVLGSSTWPGEEAALVAACAHARASGLPCSLLLVPRHAERRHELDRALAAAGVRYHLRSRGSADATVDVAVADTTGELRRLTQLADLVFVGKSLAPHTEGQTPVEAAALAKAILFGPGMGNFRTLAAELVGLGAARVVADPTALTAAVEHLLRDSGQRDQLARAAANWHRDSAGAIERTLSAIRQEMRSRS